VIFTAPDRALLENSMKSDSCFGKASGEPLSVYSSEQEASDAADYVQSEFGRELLPYLCNRCQSWHLAPADRLTPSYKCEYCIGGAGFSKATYRSRKEAEKRAFIIEREEGRILKVYPCPHSDGWHLTKRNY